MPEPRISSQPVPLQRLQRAPSRELAVPSQWKHETSTSTLGSVNGKKCGRRRTSRSSPKIARANASSVPLRSASVMSSSTASPSIWWNCGVCVASESRPVDAARDDDRRSAAAAPPSRAPASARCACAARPSLARRDVERVRARARRVRRVVVERVEVVVDGLDLGALDDGEAEADEDVLDLAPRRRSAGAGARPAAAARRAASRRRGRSPAARSSSPRLELGAARLDQRLERLARLVGGLADRAALLRRQLGDAAQQVRQLGLAPEVADAQLLERVARRSPRRSRPRPRCELRRSARSCGRTLSRAGRMRLVAGHLVQRDGRRHRGVQRLAARSGSCATRRRRAQRPRRAGRSRSAPTSSVSSPAAGPAQRLAGAARRARRAAPGSSPTSRDARQRHREDRAHLARTAFGPNGSAQPGPSATHAAPKASAERSTVPTLPGSPTPQQADAQRPGGRPPSAARRRRARASPSRAPETRASDLRLDLRRRRARCPPRRSARAPASRPRRRPPAGPRPRRRSARRRVAPAAPRQAADLLELLRCGGW